MCLKVVGIIPARGGSKGIKNKNIKLLGAKPLIAWTIEAALASKLDRLIVTTDSDDIAAIARQYGAEVPFKRPSNLATDSARAIPVLLHALKWLEENENDSFDAVMMLQPTTPFRRSKDINESIDLMAESGSDSVISVNEVGGHHPARMKFMDKDGCLKDPPYAEEYENQPRQELTQMFIRNGAIYLSRINVIKSNSFKGKVCKGLVMPNERSINIDTPFDFKLAEWLLLENQKNSN